MENLAVITVFLVIGAMEGFAATRRPSHKENHVGRVNCDQVSYTENGTLIFNTSN